MEDFEDLEEIEAAGDAESAGESTSSPGYRRLSALEWSEIEAVYALGDATGAELAKKYAISERAISRHMEKKGIRHGMSAAARDAEIKRKLAEETADDVAKRAMRIRKTKEDHYKWSEALAGLTMQEILEAKKAKSSLSSIGNNLRALRIAAETLSRLRDERYQVLDVEAGDNGDELPELVIRNLTADQIKRIQEDKDRARQAEQELDMEDPLKDLLDEDAGGDEIVEEGEDDDTP